MERSLSLSKEEVEKEAKVPKKGLLVEVEKKELRRQAQAVLEALRKIRHRLEEEE